MRRMGVAGLAAMLVIFLFGLVATWQSGEMAMDRFVMGGMIGAVSVALLFLARLRRRD